MSRIDNLIAEHCPAGVPFRPLREVAEFRRGSAMTIRSAIPGEYRLVANSPEPIGTHNESNREGEFLVIARSGAGAGTVSRWDGPLFLTDAFSVHPDPRIVTTRYVYYLLQSQQSALREMKAGGGVPHVRVKQVEAYKIPVPPLAIQREIAAILADMESLIGELEAELELRSRQHAYYRDSLLAFADRERVRWATLSEVGSLYNGLTGKAKADFHDGNARFVTYMNVFSNLATDTTPATLVKVGTQERQNEVRYGDVLFTASSESAEEVGMASGVTVEPREPLYLNSFCFGFRPNDPSELNPEFSKHLFRSAAIRSQIIKTANGVTRINISKERFRKIEIPVPAPAEQAKLAAILDRSEALVNDISIGLPAEIRARQAQYEYYRDRLLTFEELAA